MVYRPSPPRLSKQEFIKRWHSGKTFKELDPDGYNDYKKMYKQINLFAACIIISALCILLISFFVFVK